MSNFAVEHVKRVRSVVQNRMEREPAASGSRITESWIRCLNDYQLDPDSREDPEVVGRAELQRAPGKPGRPAHRGRSAKWPTCTSSWPAPATPSC